MDNFTIDEMNRVRRLMGYSYKLLAEESGVPLSTVQKVLGKQTPCPRPKTLAAIRNGLEELVRRDEENGNIIHESRALYAAGDTGAPEGFCFDKNQGRHTLEEYGRLPEKSRTELMDGVFYKLAAPAVVHQMLVSRIGFTLMQFAENHNGSIVFSASPAVKLFGDRDDILLPDIAVLCDGRKLGEVINGAPDLVIEVLSPSTKEKDLGLKLKKYREAGVKEYWLADTDCRQTVTVLFERERGAGPESHPEEIRFYGEKDKVPVGIWDGACKVDFGAIYEKIDSLYNKNRVSVENNACG